MQQNWITVLEALPNAKIHCLVFWATTADYEHGEHWGVFQGYYNGKEWVKQYGKDYELSCENKNIDIENVRQWQIIKYPKNF